MAYSKHSAVKGVVLSAAEVTFYDAAADAESAYQIAGARQVGGRYQAPRHCERGERFGPITQADRRYASSPAPPSDETPFPQPRATLAANSDARKITYICGFAATAGGATAASTVNLTVMNIVTGTMTYNYGANTGAGVPTAPLVVQFNPCLPATGPSTTIDVSMPSLGTGNTNASVNAWGLQR